LSFWRCLGFFYASHAGTKMVQPRTTLFMSVVKDTGASKYKRLLLNTEVSVLPLRQPIKTAGMYRTAGGFQQPLNKRPADGAIGSTARQKKNGQ